MFRGITDNSADLWWYLPIPLKVKVFMWLVLHNKILTRDNLRKRGWEGEIQCTICNKQESISHLFFTCHIAKQIWFWMGLCQNYFLQWHSIEDVVEFALALPLLRRKSFLIVLCAVCGALWKHRNNMIFRDSTHTSIRNLICLIISLVNYWAGGFPITLVHKVKQWLPENLDMISLQMVAPAL
jgi:zinc-binding in reverse transcriptase